ncbi:restriction endonuclease [Desulfarculus baarsii DSM 2075]|uniref:Restriction endonuclease n=1 Tax=Desulfarculus baarsii (strain ATCC 33931 / DSM 2075 / LMG 7858 / VKM B-1802 / 2st14) TaxID=644282 RepID=E1QI78_DESB2|nr:restriction endonuclease [Desulfarculus baarsii DSM 2075]
MPIPDFQSIMLPLLRYLADEMVHSNQDIYEALESQFTMTDEEKAELLPSGKQRVFINRIGWAKSYMKQAGLIDAAGRGFYKISKTGKAVAADKSLDKIGINYLLKFPSFVTFRVGKGVSASIAAQDTDCGDGNSPDRTAEEHIGLGVDTIMLKLKQELMSNIKACSPRFFEKLVVDLLLAMGYGGSRQESGMLTGKGSDEGIDGVINEDRLGLDVIYVQAKRWEHAVGRPEIQKFAGALQGKRAKKGVYITTSCFTKDAYDFAGAIDSKIILVDGERLAGLMVEHNVGVAVVQSIELKKVDMDYFIDE